MDTSVEVEYCGTCGYAKKFEEMKQVLEKNGHVNVNGYEGRRASFEVKVNGILIHSKLTTMAFPDYQELSDIVNDVKNGHNARNVIKQQPITDCIIL